MSLVSVRLDAREDRTLDPVKSFCLALVADAEALRDVVTKEFSWLGHPVGWDPAQLSKLTDWMRAGGAITKKEKLLTASLMRSLPPWIAERAFGTLAEGDRVGLFDLQRGTELATIGVVVCGRGPAKDRVRRAFDPADLVRLVRLVQALV